MAEREADRSVSQTVRAQLALRDLVLAGRPAAGRAHLGIAGGRDHRSVAHAGADGAGPAGRGGTAGGDPVRRFHGQGVSPSATFSISIELRGTLEGLAARFAAERGVSVARSRAVEAVSQRDRRPGAAGSDLDGCIFILCRAQRALPRAAHRAVAQSAVDPADRPRLGAAVRLAEQLRDGAIGLARGAPDPADRAGTSLRAWSTPSRTARARAPRR